METCLVTDSLPVSKDAMLICYKYKSENCPIIPDLSLLIAGITTCEFFHLIFDDKIQPCLAYARLELYEHLEHAARLGSWDDILYMDVHDFICNQSINK